MAFSQFTRSFFKQEEEKEESGSKLSYFSWELPLYQITIKVVGCYKWGNGPMRLMKIINPNNPKISGATTSSLGKLLIKRISIINLLNWSRTVYVNGSTFLLPFAPMITLLDVSLFYVCYALLINCSTL